MKLLRSAPFRLYPFILMVLYGCDAGGKHPGQTSVPGGGRQTPNGPRLDTLNPHDFCVGQEVVLEGINFSPVLENNLVTFEGIPGLPTRVEFPTNRNANDGLESRLHVLVPSGTVDGNLELKINGVSAGLRDYTSCPQIMSYAIGVTGQDPTLVHAGVLGFDPTQPPITVLLFGINFDDLTEATVTDRLGNIAHIPRTQFLTRALPNLVPNGLSSREISLDNATLSVSGARDNLTFQLLNAKFHSNAIQIPAADSQLRSQNDKLGAIINGAVVPPGVRTGPVRIRYSMFDSPLIDQAFSMDIQWTADDGKTYFPAVPDIKDPLHDGTRTVLPGDLDFGPPAGLFFAGGALRTFTWDAQNDENFQTLTGSSNSARNFTIKFRIHPIPETTVQGKPGDIKHFYETPPIAYFDLSDRGGTDFSAERAKDLSEAFTTTEHKDLTCNDAIWGPPRTPGELHGSIPSNVPPQEATGTLDLKLEKAKPPAPGPESFLIDTTNMRILHLIDDGTGTNTVSSIQLFPTVDNPNPGEKDHEFHIRSLKVDSGLDVRLEGNFPLIFRVSGGNLLDTDLSVAMSGTLHAIGEAGGAPVAPGPNTQGAPGAGGPGHAGGGSGGDGANLGIDAVGGVTGLLNAGAGGNDGGDGGLTAAAIDPNTDSKFRGAPGGGGGNRLEGGAGDSGVPASPTIYNVPRAGRGGPMRGSGRLVPLSPGSGGGGGGATIVKKGTAFTPGLGGGGGGGGGAVQITGHGSMLIDGKIQVNGGKGGDGKDGGAGGGGSGGCILLQSSGFISVGCTALEAAGGAHGNSAGQNVRLGSGDGSPGWIRVEPRLGGGPYCGALALETELAAALDTSVAASKTISVKDNSRFPPRGVVMIDSEVIGYNSVGPNLLSNLTRGLRGTTVASHSGPPTAAKVILDAPVFPPEGLVRGSSDVTISPDPVDSGSGPDGVLNAFFMATIDPNTGEQLLDSVTGRAVSVWTLDTDASSVTNPEGTLVLEAATARTDPGVFQLTRLRIDQDVVLRVSGTKPLKLKVIDFAEIAGKLDLSGFDGGQLQFDVNALEAPSPGPGGLPGPGGGSGGAGGSITFVDKNLDNKDPANTAPVPAQTGGLPPLFPPEFDRTGTTSGSVPPPSDLAFLETTRATGGDPLRDPTTCGGTLTSPCSAGGGGGGGARLSGSNGDAKPQGSTAFGRGGSPLGIDSFRFGGGLFLMGGEGGAGGGPSAVVSDDYKNLRAGNSFFQGKAKYGPGTGGGGGGGVLQLSVQGALVMRSSGSIVARGGNSYQSIDLAGNGGGGGGGSVLIQLANSLNIEPGARIDVGGGHANLPPSISPGQTLPFYEGNIRKLGTSSELRSFGGNGGDGAIGRVRVEAPPGSNLLRTAFNDSLSSSFLLLDSSLSVGCSDAFTLGVGPGKLATSHLLLPGSPVIRFADQGLPEGTDALLLWKGAAQSLDVHGAHGPLRGGVEDPRDLQDTEYVQFQVEIFLNGTSREGPTIQEIKLPYSLGNPATSE